MIRPSLVLASSSPIRAEMLTKNRIPFDVEPARIDEAAVKQSLIGERASPRDIVDTLAELKAQKIAAKHPDRLVLGVDQVLVFKKEIFDKAPDIAVARRQLLALRGQSHELLSAAVFFEDNKPVWRHIGRAQLIMRNFSDDFLNSYVDRHGDDLLATVGCYKLEEDGAQLFTRVQGDYFSVLGMPLLEVLDFLRSRGVLQE